MFKFDLETSDRAQKHLIKVERKIDKTQPSLIKAGLLMMRSIDENFRQEGRPHKWKGLSPMTIGLRRKGKKTGRGIMILQDTGRLKGSITKEVLKDHVRIGTNLKYAPLMQKGGMSDPKTLKIKEHRRKITQAFGKPIRPKSIMVRSHDMKIGSKKIPARPFLLFQKEDLEAINKLFLNHVEVSAKA